MKRCAALLVAVVLMVGCAGRQEPNTPPEPVLPVPPVPLAPVLPPVAPAPDPQPATPNLERDVDPDQLQEHLREWVNAGGKVEAIFSGEPYPDAIHLARVDLDSDGTLETITAPKDSHPITGPSAIYVIYRKGERYEVDRTPDAPKTHLPRTGVRLHAVTDLTGDGRPEIVWSSSQLMAHSPPSDVFVTQWAPGKLTDLPGAMGMIKMHLTVDGSDVLLTGGGVGGGSSGLGQPHRTDRYRWLGGTFRLVDRVMLYPEFGYSLLMQAISDEDLGKPERAVHAYRQLLDPAQQIYPYHTLHPAGNEAMQPRFEAAVRSFARFRLGLLLLGTPDLKPLLAGQEGLPQALATATSRPQACSAAANWMRQNPTFQEALNSLAGYVHPNWNPDNVCGALHEATSFVTRP